MSTSILVRGPLGVGKSTVSAALAGRIGAEHIRIDRILEQFDLEEWDRDRISLRSFLRANAIAVDQARRGFERGQSAIFDGCFYWREQVEDLVERLSGRLIVFTLQAPLSVCIERDRTRPVPRAGEQPRGGEQQGAGAAIDVYKLVSEVPYGLEVDASGSLDTTVGTILSRLPARTDRGT